MQVTTGLERVLHEKALRDRLDGKRVGWLVHAASVDVELRHAVDAGIAAGLVPSLLFGPEHGLRGGAQDMVGVDSARDPLTGIETVSLYGHDVESLAPRAEHLSGLDLVLIDLQDIGTRYYTYAYSAALMIEAACKAGVEAWVLDRPNPLGGTVLEGNVVIEEYTSFVGMYPGIATRHGMTIGELMRLLAERYGWGDGLEVVEMTGWSRTMTFDQTHLPWVMPSPNMPTLETAVVYPGQCLLEGTELSEGRGTTRPFELFGAPWIDPISVRAELEDEHLEGARLRDVAFEPTFQKHAKQSCRGFQLHVHDPLGFRSLAASLALLKAIRAVHPENFQWREEAYEFVDDKLAIDLLLGDPLMRHALEDAIPISELLKSMALSRASFEDERRRHLIYEA